MLNILFGVFNDNEDFAILNHLLLIAKYFIYKCKLNKTKPTLRVFIEKIKLIYHIEREIAKRNDRLQKHYEKWEKNIASLLSINLKFSFFSMFCTYSLRWLKTVSSTFQDVDCDVSFYSVTALRSYVR